MTTKKISHNINNNSDIHNIFNSIQNTKKIHDVYLNLDKITKSNLLTLLQYKNAPNMRLKIIQKHKSFDFNKTIYDLLNVINDESKNINNINKIFIVSSNKAIVDYIINEKFNFLIINENEFNNIIVSDKKENILLIN